MQAPEIQTYLRVCKRYGILPTRYVLIVNIAQQTTSLLEKAGPCSCCAGVNAHYYLLKKYRCSTSKFGIGEVANSNMTPRGLHRVAEKVGGGWPVGTAFTNRQMVGFTWDGKPGASITNRIFWLEGLEPGLNRGGNVDSHARYIYVHGTGDEPGIGRPASHGCVHLSANDLIPLYDKLPVGTLVWITER